jgi:hypothetical protein
MTRSMPGWSVATTVWACLPVLNIMTWDQSMMCRADVHIRGIDIRVALARQMAMRRGALWIGVGLDDEVVVRKAAVAGCCDPTRYVTRLSFLPFLRSQRGHLQIYPHPAMAALDLDALLSPEQTCAAPPPRTPHPR